MDIVTDLTAEAVSYITLFQDILKRNIDDNLGNEPDGINLHKKEFIKNLTVSQKEKIMDLVWHSPSKCDMSSIIEKYFERTALLVDWLSDTLPVISSVANKSLQETKKLILYKPPFFWRQTIREALYKKPNERLELVQILQYMPLQVILAITGKGRLDYMIRLYQFYEERPHEKSAEKKKDNYDLLEGKDRDLHELFWEISNEEAKKYLKNDNELLKKLKEKEFSLPFETLFRDELVEISEARKLRVKEFTIASKNYDFEKLISHTDSLDKQTVFDPLGKASEMKLMGIALSGGGIRSATFNLGILQRLASLNVLREFDYISTVSGGGYIGSWFNSWIHRTGSFTKVSDRLCAQKSGDPLADEVRPVRWLRMFSNYLSPNTGIMSADAWASGMTWLRNTFINQVVLLLSLLTILSSISDIYLVWNYSQNNMKEQSPSDVFWWSLGMFVVGSFLAAIAMRSFYSIIKKKSNNYLLKQLDKFILFRRWKIDQPILIPHLIVCWGGISALLIITYFAGCYPPIDPKERFLLSMGIFASSFLAFFWLAMRGNYHKRWDLMEIGKKNVNTKRPSRNPGLSWQIWLAIITSSLAASALLAFLLMLFWLNIHKFYNLEFLCEADINHDKMFLVFGIPIILEIFSLSVILRMAIMGNLFPDYRREWWARMGGYIHRFMMIWIFVSFAALIMPNLWNKWSAELEWSIVWGWSGWAGIIAWGLKKAFESKDETQSSGKSYTTIFLKIIPFVFMIGVLLIGSWMTAIIREDGFIFYKTEKWQIVFITIVLVIITFLLSWRVGVNEFSLHHFYRNRLIRAFLGATRSREDRIKTANAFTGFDANDDILLSSLRTQNGYFGPFPLINSTLNATVTGALDRQDRMGESFVFSPLYCGYDFSPTRSSTYNIDHVYEYGYRPTSQFSNKDGGPTLGTAMAISGAAVNPNWGYHSSATMAFLLTLFNLRLGWWIGNPRLDRWKRPDPNFGLLYLMRDLIGKSDINMKYVCLSDGGHFDNMGLYELVRRRCQYILIGDAEQDQDATCEGLANAIRRCRIDFGVEINFDLDFNDIINKKEHIAKGTIIYPGAVKQIGTLIYIKTVVTGKESVDVREYALANKDFPQQSTGDQFFDEAQFESYRKLGYSSIKDISQLYLNEK